MDNGLHNHIHLVTVSLKADVMVYLCYLEMVNSFTSNSKLPECPSMPCSTPVAFRRTFTYDYLPSCKHRH